MSKRNHHIGFSITKEENEEINEFMKENELYNKSDLLRRLLMKASIVSSNYDPDKIHCSRCGKNLKMESFWTSEKSGEITCKYCMAGI